MKLTRTSEYYSVITENLGDQKQLFSFKTIEECLAKALKINDMYITGINTEMKHWIIKNNHEILRRRYWCFA